MVLGHLGVWSTHFWADRQAVRVAASELEQLGYGTLWFPNGPGIVDLANDMLDATQRITVASGIASIWTHPAEQMARDLHVLDERHPSRFLLGLGVSHPHLVNKEEASRYKRPVEHMLAYLDQLDAAPTPVPRERRVLAALGPRMLSIARERSAGAHPYLTTPEHTRRAREVLGEGPILAPEQAVVLETDPEQARRIARAHLARYLQAVNYVNNWLRLGFTHEDIANGGSDRLVDALVAWGTVEDIQERIEAHFRAGASHVAIQALSADPAAMPWDAWRALAPVPMS